MELMNRRRRAVQERDAGNPTAYLVERRITACGSEYVNMTVYLTYEDNQYRLTELGDFNVEEGAGVATVWNDIIRTIVAPDGWYKFLSDPPNPFGEDKVYLLDRGYLMGYAVCEGTGGGEVDPGGPGGDEDDNDDGGMIEP